MDLSHSQLKIFCDLAREKNFSKVAKLNHLTQPSISSRVKQLESALGVKLFERVPRKVVLTKEGELLLPLAEDLLLRCENMREVLARAKSTPSGEIRVAATYSLGMYELSPTLRRFIAGYPSIHVHLQYRRSDIIYDLVLKKKTDLGLVAYPEERQGIRVIPCGIDRLVLVVPPSHPLANKRSIRAEKLAGEPFIAFQSGVPTGESVSKLLSQMGVEVDVRLANDNIDTLKRGVEAGLGVSILPELSVADEVEHGSLVKLRLSNLEIKRPFGLIVLKDKVLSYPAELFAEMLAGKKKIDQAQKSSRRAQQHAIQKT